MLAYLSLIRPSKAHSLNVKCKKIPALDWSAQPDTIQLIQERCQFIHFSKVFVI